MGFNLSSKSNSLICLFYCLILLSTFLFKPENVKAQQYYFQNYNIENGLSQTQSLCLAQDKTNKLWIGTLSGLSVFDGINFRNYSRFNGLISNTILSIDFELNGTAWIGTNEGISCFNGLSFKNYVLSRNVDSNFVNFLKVDYKNQVWAVVNNKLYHFENGKFILKNSLDDIIIDLKKDKNGALYLVYLRSGVKKLDNENWIDFAPAPPGYLLNIATNKKNEIYALANTGIYLFKNGVFTKTSFDISSIDFGNYNLELVVEENNKIWIGTYKGMYVSDQYEFKHIGISNGYTDEQTVDILIDNNANLWFATNGSGIYNYSKSLFSRFDYKYIPNGKSISSINQYGNYLRLGSNILGVYDFNIKDYAIKKADIPQLPAIYNSFLQNSDYGILVNAPPHIYQIKDNKTTIYKTRNIQYFVDAKLINNQLWLLANNGIYKIINKEPTEVINKQNLKFIFSTKANSILIGGIDSVFTLDTLRQELKLFKNLSNLRAINVVEDNNRFYFATEDNGLAIFDKSTEKLSFIDQKQGLSCNFIYNLLIDKSGNIWAGTGCGIDRITYLNQNEFKLKSFQKADGLTGAESNINASFEDSNGDLWFATTKGLFKYEPQQESSEVTVPYVSLTDLLLYSKAFDPKSVSDSIIPFVNLPYKPTFNFDQNYLTFNFRAVSLNGSDKIIYKYKLVGADDEFIETKLTTVVYNKLAPGNYTFIVYASDQNGNWHENAYHYPFIIKPTFYQTIWFKVLALGFILTAVFLLIKKYSNAKKTQLLRDQKLRDDAQNKIRQRTAEDFHDEIGNKITRINLLTMMAEKKAGDNENLQHLLSQIRDNTQSLYYGSKDIIWALQKESNYLKEAILRIQQNTIAILNETHIELIVEEAPKIIDDVFMPMDFSRNLILIFKEATNNAIKYAGATRLILRFYEDLDNSLVMELEDNGKGFDIDQVKKGNGLQNMQNRAAAIKANFSINSLEGMGTLIRLRLFKYSFK